MEHRPPSHALAPDPARRWRRAGELSLIAAVAAAVLLLGGALWEATAVVAVLAALGFIAAARAERLSGQPLRLPPLSVAFGLVAALALLQLLPLPPSLLRALSPRAAEVAVLNGEGGARPLTLDLAATWKGVAQALAYALLIAAGAMLARDRATRNRLLAGIAFTGGLLAVVGLGHALLELEHLFGFALFEHARPALVTPFGNTNHLAAFLTLSATIALGLFLSTDRSAADQRPARLGFGLTYLLSGIALLLSLSRGGMLGFALAQLLLVALVLRNRARSEGTRIRRSALAALAGGLVAAVAAWVGYERIAFEWGASSGGALQKLQFWPMILEGIRQFPLTGMGRGAFEAAFTRFQTDALFLSFTHPENLLLQLSADFGVVGGAVALLALAWGASWLGRHGRNHTADYAVLAGAAGVLVHELADFSLELPAVMSALVVALATLARHESPAAQRPLGRQLVFPGIALAVLAISLPLSYRTLARDEAALSTLLSRRAPLSEVEAAAQATLRRHPAAYSAHALLGTAYASARPPDHPAALAAFGRALFLRPFDSYAHLGAARSLLALGRKRQALLEFRLAHEAHGEGALDEGLAQVQTAEELAVLAGGRLSEVLPVVERAAHLGKGRLVLRLLEALLAQPVPLERAGPLWLFAAELRLGQGELAGAGAALERVEGGVAEDRLLAVRAEVLHRRGERAQARQLLEEARARLPRSIPLATTQARHLAADGEIARAREVLATVRALVPGRYEKVTFLIEEARLLEAEQRHAGALDLYRTAARLMPRRPDVHYAMARLLERMGRDEDAITALREGLKVDDGPSAASARQQLEQLQARLDAR